MSDKKREVMMRKHAEMIHKIGKELDLSPGDDLHKKIIPAINTIKAYSNVLRACIETALTLMESGDYDEAADALTYSLELTPEHVMEGLEAEFDELYRRQMTPTMEMILQSLHDEAGRCDTELTSPIFIRVDPHDYDALCAEESANEMFLVNDRETENHG